ncbi:hypothetical protein [Candidatus Endowatersipora endosymbiont of Watersipora subatra]|uniref:hypothetical protein n=1 Tax=Candidatus Endowatersipora endosymbiont of Watersipora subatra TaxID=3077946 RepID=UPI00312C9C27
MRKALFLYHALSAVFLAFLISGSGILKSLAQENNTEYTELASRSFARIPSHQLLVNARLVNHGDIIESGMIWRIFSDIIDKNGRNPLIATSKGGSAILKLVPGDYLVHASFGRAGITQRVKIYNEDVELNVVLQAGGLLLNADSGGEKISPRYLTFSIYENEKDETGERQLIACNVTPNKVIPLNEGTYHVISQYGKINAITHADLEVEAGSTTHAMLHHNAAPVRMKLISKSGGYPVANTSWSVFNSKGKKIFSSQHVSPFFILEKGKYEAYAGNGQRRFKTTFQVIPGLTHEIEIIIK